MPYSGLFEVVTHRLKQLYENVEPSSEDSDDDVPGPSVLVHKLVVVKRGSEKHVILLWNSDPLSDMVSDSIVSVILNIAKEVPRVMAVEETPGEDGGGDEKEGT